MKKKTQNYIYTFIAEMEKVYETGAIQWVNENYNFAWDKMIMDFEENLIDAQGKPDEDLRVQSAYFTIMEDSKNYLDLFKNRNLQSSIDDFLVSKY